METFHFKIDYVVKEEPLCICGYKRQILNITMEQGDYDLVDYIIHICYNYKCPTYEKEEFWKCLRCYENQNIIIEGYYCEKCYRLSSPSSLSNLCISLKKIILYFS